MAGSYPSTLLVAVLSLVSPPMTHTTPSSTVLATSWRAVGASWAVRQGDESFAGGADDAEDADVVLVGVNGRTSLIVVDAAWLGTCAPLMAYIDVPTVATAIPWRGVSIGGNGDHTRFLMS